MSQDQKPDDKQTLFERFDLTIILVFTVLIALIIVAISYWMYYNNPQRKYDIARPGDNEINKVLTIEDDTEDTSKPVDLTDAKQKLETLGEELKALGGFNSYGPDGLSDQSLGLQPNDQPAQ